MKYYIFLNLRLINTLALSISLGMCVEINYQLEAHTDFDKGHIIATFAIILLQESYIFISI